MKLIQGQDWQSKFPRQWLGAPPNGKNYIFISLTYYRNTAGNTWCRREQGDGWLGGWMDG